MIHTWNTQTKKNETLYVSSISNEMRSPSIIIHRRIPRFSALTARCVLFVCFSSLFFFLCLCFLAFSLRFSQISFCNCILLGSMCKRAEMSVGIWYLLLIHRFAVFPNKNTHRLFQNYTRNFRHVFIIRKHLVCLCVVRLLFISF